MLSRNRMLDEQGRVHVDILELPHHGSDRNVTAEFFNIINANYYLISANGRDDNPSFDTLNRIIESFGNTKKFKKIVFTNKTQIL